MKMSFKKFDFKPWLAWSSVALFYAYQYVLRVFPSVAMPEIMHAYEMNAGLFGQFSGIYYIGYGLAHLPLGFWLDRFGPKKVIPLCCCLCVIGLLPLIFAGGALPPIVGRLLIGIGSSGAILGAFKIIRMTFPTDLFSRILGITVAIGLIGALYGSKPFYHLMQRYDWQICVLILMGVGLILAVAMYFILPEDQGGSGNEISLRAQVKDLFGNKSVILISLFAGFMVAPLEGFADIWGTEFLMRLYNQSKEAMAFYPSLIFIGMGIGAPMIGALSDATKKYFLIIMAAAMIMAGIFMLLLFVPLPQVWLPVLLIVLGVCSAYQIPAITKATFYVPEKLVGFTTAFVNMVIMMFGYLYHGVIGAALGQNLETGAAMYTLAQFKTGLLVIPMGLIIGFIGFAWLRQVGRQG
ncbi:MAG: MFS transporter [Rickettsiales bacterium]|nr:MFS transporter [Rickettsiales bacterium]|tara:strand:- start:61885 stop:63111 length:1227 start_codon:yes stop_codon:yes gene_type:complete